MQIFLLFKGGHYRRIADVTYCDNPTTLQLKAAVKNKWLIRVVEFSVHEKVSLVNPEQQMCDMSSCKASRG